MKLPKLSSGPAQKTLDSLWGAGKNYTSSEMAKGKCSTRTPFGKRRGPKGKK